jgi:monofunctional glycosyltransferase
MLLSVLVVLGLRWIPPPTSAFMLTRQFTGIFQKGPQPPLRYQWMSRQKIAPQIFLAVIAAEDQKFPDHWGFDVDSIRQAVKHNTKPGRRVRGASTITQQVAKNLFLWSGRSYVRKGLEAYFTVLIELLWSKERILEVYVNLAEFGNGIYGVAAAAETFWGKSPADLRRGEAARLAAVLPNPKGLNAQKPSPYVIKRERWIEEQMNQLGGVSYLERL